MDAATGTLHGVIGGPVEVVDIEAGAGSLQEPTPLFGACPRWTPWPCSRSSQRSTSYGIEVDDSHFTGYVSKTVALAPSVGERRQALLIPSRGLPRLGRLSQPV